MNSKPNRKCQNQCTVYSRLVTRVRPSMSSSAPYWTNLHLTSAGCIESAKCNCKSGASGLYKHVAAVWYHLWGLQKKKPMEMLAHKAPTEVPAYWVERMKPGTEGLPFQNIIIMKHKNQCQLVLIMNLHWSCSIPTTPILVKLTNHLLHPRTESSGPLRYMY